MSQLTRTIEDRLGQAFGVPLAVEQQDDDVVVVTGMLDSDEAKEQALALVSEAAPSLRVEDNIEVVAVLSDDVAGLSLAEGDVGDMTGATAHADAEDSLEAGDFTDQEPLASPRAAMGPSTSMDDDVSDGDAVYTPPTDPVGTDEEVIGGFQQTSMDSVEVVRSALDGQPGDEALRDAILRELREDAATTDLVLDIAVERGVARVRGRVPYLSDAENAEAVAARIPGVIEVIEETRVEQLESPG